QPCKPGRTEYNRPDVNDRPHSGFATSKKHPVCVEAVLLTPSEVRRGRRYTPPAPFSFFGVNYFYEMDSDERSSLLRFCICRGGTSGETRSSIAFAGHDSSEGDGVSGARPLQRGDGHAEADACDKCRCGGEEASGIAGSALCHDNWRPGQRGRIFAKIGK